MAASVSLAGRQNHSYSSNQANTKQAQLANAYQALAKELASDKIKVVGGYTLGKVIGEGTFGSVHLATHRTTGIRCAIKKVPKSATPQLTRELHHHRRLHHPHIVHLHEIIATEAHIWLVFELCSGGELFDYLVERGRILEGEARRIFGELCTAVGYLHNQGVVHRDLKLENVLLDGELRVKLGDLGFAREYQKGRLMETFCGTTGYASPEMLSGRKYLGVETDIWSLGIILYTLLCGGLPFDDDDERVMRDLIVKGVYEEPDWLTEEARSLIRGMLQLDPSNRLSMEGILTHPWFQRTLYDNLQGSTSATTEHRVPSVPPSPLLGHSTSSDTGPMRQMSSPSISSFPFSPRRSASGPSGSGVPPPPPPPPPPLLPQKTEQLTASPDAESEPSETSFEFIDSTLSKSASGDTTPTTAENEEELQAAVAAGDDAEEGPELKRTHSGEDSKTERALELLHKNSSESTIKRPPDSPSGSSSASGSALREKLAKRNTLMALEGHREEIQVYSPTKGDSKRLSTTSLPMIDEHSLPLPVADHSRTPLRTKRRSLTSQIPLERKQSHHSNSSQCQVFLPDDYLILLNAEQPPLFSTPSEKRLLHKMSDLGFDTGQLIHSVMNDACDCAAAMWWILRFKQLERGETDEMIQARAQAHARERERRRVQERLSRSRDPSPGTPLPNPVLTSLRAEKENGGTPPTFTVSSATPSRSKTPDHVSSTAMSSATSTSTIKEEAGASTATISTTATRTTPPSSTSGAAHRALHLLSADLSPPRTTDRKARTTSMTMLQRATTSVLGLGQKHKEPKDPHHHLHGKDKENTPDLTDGEKSIGKREGEKLKREMAAAAGSTDKLPPGSADKKRAESPTKIGKLTIPSMPKMTKSDSDTAVHTPQTSTPLAPRPKSQGITPDGSPGFTSTPLSGVTADDPTSAPRSATDAAAAKSAKGSKKDSLWTAFRHLFVEDRRRKGRESLPPTTAALPSSPKPTPTTVVPQRGARGQYMSRTAQQTPSRRTSFDGRVMYSHRSSSVNSRRSSIASNHPPTDFTINLHDGLNHNLHRRTSGRSARSVLSNGAQTPTSDREPISRPGSAHSRRGGSRRSSLRSPTIQSEAGSLRRRSDPPRSPLHDYHRRAASGGASTRVRHIKVLHEAKAIRPSSVASSIRSNPSSRASSVDFGRGHGGGGGGGSGGGSAAMLGAGDDSDFDDASSVRSLRRYLADERSGNAIAQLLAQNNRARGSPLARPSASAGAGAVAGLGLGRVKPPLRDVFQRKDGDDDWESEEDDGTFAGGLGQAPSSAWGGQSKWLGSTSFPSTANASAPGFGSRYSSSGKRAPPGFGGRGGGGSGAAAAASGFGAGASGLGSTSSTTVTGSTSDDIKGKGSEGGMAGAGSSTGAGASTRGRRGNLAPTRNQAPVIEEEEEEEE